MNALKRNCFKLNCLLTRIIIQLHEKGYSEDFIMIDKEKYVCIQSNREFSICSLQIEIFNIAFDQFSGCYKYVHTIETHTGLKGVLIADTLYFNPIFDLDNQYN